MMTPPKQRKLRVNCLLKDIKGSKCCIFKVRQYTCYLDLSVRIYRFNTTLKFRHVALKGND